MQPAAYHLGREVMDMDERDRQLLSEGLREIAAHLDSVTEWSGRDTGYVEGIVAMLQAIVDR